MGDVVGHREGVKARKQHRCFWCWEFIERGDLYDTWTWIDNGPENIKVHPECGNAWCEVAREEGGIYETSPGEHQRGCACQAGQCECVKGQSNAETK